MTNFLTVKDGIKQAIASTRVALKAIDEDLSLLRDYVRTPHESIPSEHYPCWYLGTFTITSTTDASVPILIRLQEDAPFVCTGIGLLISSEYPQEGNVPPAPPLLGMSLVDESSGRRISNPTDELIPMAAFKSAMSPSIFYLGQNFYYELPAEVTFPANGIVRAQVDIDTTLAASYDVNVRKLTVALFGYKIFGG